MEIKFAAISPKNPYNVIAILMGLNLGALAARETLGHKRDKLRGVTWILKKIQSKDMI